MDGNAEDRQARGKHDTHINERAIQDKQWNCRNAMTGKATETGKRKNGPRVTTPPPPTRMQPIEASWASMPEHTSR